MKQDDNDRPFKQWFDAWSGDDPERIDESDWLNITMIVIAIAAGIFLIWTAIAATPAEAHFSPGGMEYPKDCCKATECAPIKSEYITEDEDFFYLNLPENSHHYMKKEYSKPFKKFKYGRWSTRIKWSTDGEYHACCSDQNCYCIIIPPRGF